MTSQSGLVAPIGSQTLYVRLTEACASADRWPLPGQGRTALRFALLAAVARRDLVLARLVEAHADAVAIAAELGYSGVENGETWAVWAAGPSDSVMARQTGGKWVLEGMKSWCSGASLVSHALVDAAAPDGQRLFAVAVRTPEVRMRPASWSSPGMQRSDTRSVTFAQTSAEAVGQPGEYLTRPGFWMGAIGVAACWHGGSRAVARSLYVRGRKGEGDPISMAHLGAVHIAISEDVAVLVAAAKRVDRQPSRDHSLLALTVRDTVERNAVDIMDHVGRALGPAPLAHDADHARSVTDLSVYVRQSHADYDRAEIGRLVCQRSA